MTNALFNLPNATDAVNESGFAAAIAAGSNYLRQDPAQCQMTNFIIAVASGTWNFAQDTVPAGAMGLIRFNMIRPPLITTAEGKVQLYLVIQGAGSGARTTGVAAGKGAGSNYRPGQPWVARPRQTTLITSKVQRLFYGHDSSHIVIEGMTVMQDYSTASQGTVSFPYGSEPSGQVTVDIQPGFAPPTAEYVDCSGHLTFTARSPDCKYQAGQTNGFAPQNIIDPADQPPRRFLRVYDNVHPLNPKLNQARDNLDFQWGADSGAGGAWRASTQPDAVNYPDRWTIYISYPAKVLPAIYAQGALVCIKAKQQNAYLAMMFAGTGSGIVINDMRFIGDGESAFLGGPSAGSGMTQTTVENSENVRPNAVGGQKACIASSYGGLQMGGTLSGLPATGGNRINNFYADGTGDDSVAFFGDEPNAALGLAASFITNATINDSFARTILSYASSVSNTTEAHGNIVSPTCNASVLDPTNDGNGCPVLTGP